MKRQTLYSKRWREKNPDKVKAQKQRYRAKHKGLYQMYKEGISQWRKDRRKTDPKYRLNCNIGSKISEALKREKRGCHWERLVGYTLKDLMSHLESLFDKEMAWNNYGKWHIDHKKPRSLFNYGKPEDKEFKRCWALENLQPLWAKDNLIKSNKY